MSASLQFYHLRQTRYDRALPLLLGKAYAAEMKCGVKVANDAEVKKLDDYLWSYDPASFLPHGANKPDHASHHPILLNSTYEFANAPSVLVITDGSEPESFDGYQKVLFLFDGNNETALQNARSQWKGLKAKEHDLSYFQQQAEGGWKKQA